MVPDNRAVFALDIGTRTVIGIVGIRENDKLRIIAQDMLEHASRVMYDGQIHDIPQVAVAAGKIKASLERKVGYGLEKVAIAAAGRSLKTKRAFVEQQISEYVEIDSQTVHSLEVMAVRKAFDELLQEIATPERFYYVGHGVISYYMDDFPINNLLGHRAKRIGIDLVATFLPASVVESLFSVLSRAGLQPVNLTLEPIAAADVAVPEGLRLLNLALVDIGAGTSDIAITRDGTVVAYGMVPVAGDEITEVIVDACLVDFQTAEQIKRQLKEGKEIAYRDILGNETSISYENLIGILDPVLNQLAEEIARTILNLNGGQPPKSVFCVGGGSQVPTLTDRIASQLKISPQRVGIRNRSMLPDLLTVEDDELSGPQGVTVVGIATLAFKNAGYSFINVKINGKEYNIFNFQGLNVSHCLSYTDFKPRSLIGQNGKDLKFLLNGKSEVVFGELSRPAQVYLNGREAHLQSPVQNNDEIVFVAAQNGRDARAFIRDYISEEFTTNITLNGKALSLRPACTVNDLAVTPDEEIRDGDRVVIDGHYTIERIVKMQGLNLEDFRVYVNGVEVPGKYLLKEGDNVEILPVHKTEETTKNMIQVTVNGRPVKLITQNAPIFVDVFNYIDFDVTKGKGGLVLKLNGKDAHYTAPLHDGDEIEIRWE